MFLSVLSANVIALALVAQTSLLSTGFTAFALVLLPIVLFLGLATYLRLVSANHDEHRWVRGSSRRWAEGRPAWRPSGTPDATGRLRLRWSSPPPLADQMASRRSRKVRSASGYRHP
jgi:hypothetical protein